ncbi:MAG: hypothetical protein IJC14_02940 [Firmicutes bacterium]|nr:hypothetical protein [Clostridiales bacterium]MBQ3123095.1 hypothetical protein [Bacillota bacterium]
MSTIFILIAFAFVVAVALLVLKADAARDILVKASALIIAVLSIWLAVDFFGSGEDQWVYAMEGTHTLISNAMLVIETVLSVIVIYLGIKYKKYLASVFALIQAPTMIWFELTKGHHIHVANNIVIDRLSVIMILIVGIVGSLITVYATAYMKDFQHHFHGPDRRPFFFFLMFIFLSAMFGLVVSNNIVWMFFFWEITTLCSFFLIGYTKTEEAINNSFRQLILNLIGGLSFVVGILTLGIFYETLELSTLIAYGTAGMGALVVIPTIFLVIAGMTKAAQMPFHSWLLGAMVAPTPTSALLHSSTMVKAGVFLIIKLAPCLGMNMAGMMTMLVGGITFLLASFAAISQSNGKRLLAFSTIANLGLIVICGGIGTEAAVWAGIMLIIFHSITKSLMFLCVGTTEHQIGSRDIEDMDAMFAKLPRLATFMMVGIIGMFCAPMGMLVSKWAAMTAMIDSGNFILVAIICFGSAATAFYWTKWLGKLSAIVPGRENIEKNVPKEETLVHSMLVLMAIAVCLVFPLVSKAIVIPYISAIFGTSAVAALSSNNMIIMCIMLAVVLILVLLFYGKTNKKVVDIYMAGANMGDNLTYMGSMQTPMEQNLRNWYMESYFGEKKMDLIGVFATTAIICTVVAIAVGTILGVGGGF